MQPHRILIVDDENDFRGVLLEALEQMGYETDGAENAEKAIQVLKEHHYAIVLTDLNMPGGRSGLDLLKSIRELAPKTFTILMTGFATTESAIQSLKHGAYDFIQKPFKLAELEASLKRAINHYTSVRANEAYQTRLEEMVKERTAEITALKVDIENLFEGFVKASVTAIEARDPSTSGHSSRVADLTVGLARAVNATEAGLYGHIKFTEEQIKEMRYAALLHDFGKVGVREQVLVKAKKLQPERLERILQRIHQRELEAMLAFYARESHEGLTASQEAVNQLQEAIRSQSAELMNLVLRCNEPQVLAQEVADHLGDLEKLDFDHYSGRREPIVEPGDIQALRIPRGSLSFEEREEINSHAAHSYRFLKQIPWTTELSNLPEIAYAHHERLNGKGYPRHLEQDEIPVQSKLMAVADVYDGLAASDRPYKAAVSVSRSLEILEEEAKAGLLDKEILKIFIEAKVFEITQDYKRS